MSYGSGGVMGSCTYVSLCFLMLVVFVVCVLMCSTLKEDLPRLSDGTKVSVPVSKQIAALEASLSAEGVADAQVMLIAEPTA